MLAGQEALEQAIRLKQIGVIKVLWAGPNLVVTPTGSGNVLQHPSIDKVVVPSEWVANFYIRLAPVLQGKILVWPAGVDCDVFWKPLESCNAFETRKTILLFKKLVHGKSSRWDLAFQKCCTYLQEIGRHFAVLEYGSFSKETYRRTLAKSCLVVYWTDAPESQGIALAEAWSMNVPTLVSASEFFLYAEACYSASSAPYLVNQCGQFFHNWRQLREMLPSYLKDEANSKSPRE